MRELLSFLKSSKQEGIETIVYSTGQKYYVDRLVDILDPKKEVFDHILYQNACYVFEKEDEDIHLLLKDISRFQNRDLRRSVLMDPRPVNFIMTPENGYPVVPFNAEFVTKKTDVKDDYLLSLIEDIKELKKLDDVRPYLDEQFKVRQTLKSAKLI
jgi:TFIIF-interacting CTD phosphatase-like protein